MYITISPQKTGGKYQTSVADFVNYLEKENADRAPDQTELFFNQDSNKVSPKEVIKEIDSNTAKLKTTEPRYYSITINPSQHEIRHINNDPGKLKDYTRQLMRDYASCFNREINGRPIQVSDIKYYGKIEYTRTYKGTDKEVRENAPYSNRLAKLENDLRKIDRGELRGSLKLIRNEIKKIRELAPHQLDGKLIEQGMPKPGTQTHIHLVVSRKDMSNSISLSPGSKYKASQVVLHGQTIKRGFDRDTFFQKAEERFDRQFNFKRNYVEHYSSRKLLHKAPGKFYSNLLKLPTSERKMAMKLLKGSQMIVPIIPNSKVRLAIKQLQKALEISIKSSTIGY